MEKEKQERRKAPFRTFANPQTLEAADGHFPTMEELAAELTIETKDGFKQGTKENILNEGTLLDKLRLYYIRRDLSGYFDTDGEFSKEDMAKVRGAIRSEEDIELLKVCMGNFNTLIEFGRRLSYQYKRFQTSFGKLAVLLNKWSDYERMVTVYNQLRESIWAADYTDKPMPELYREHDLNFLNAKVLLLTKLDGAEVRETEDRESAFYLYVNGRGGLYSQIRETAKEAAQELCDFKAYVMAAEEYKKKTTLNYTPISIRMSVENAEEERYTRYLVKDLSFFRSELNLRKDRGETISPEAEKRAVIPDYCESIPTKRIYRECLSGIKLIEAGIPT